MKKMLPWMITILLSITLIVLAVVLLSDKLGSSENTVSADQNIQKPMTADEIVAVTAVMDSLTTNLADPETVVRMSFAFQLSSEEAKEEFEKIKDIKVKSIVIKALADTKPESLYDSKGAEQFTAVLANKINSILTEGKLIQVDITEKVISSI